MVSGYTESLDDSSEIAVPDDDYGLYAIDILDPSWVSFVLFLSCPLLFWAALNDLFTNSNYFSIFWKILKLLKTVLFVLLDYFAFWSGFKTFGTKYEIINDYDQM